ncbi:hypothetical protein ABE425_23375 [Chryseobacterium cucumeris]|uniref:Uncharacterized protein n=1 Tax=Chryseobacterium cucumeris TaxID=1813611 RepID=A0ABX9X7A3_9FLAO|nr:MULTISPECIES: hypothetical protein [Chryseobacterium]KYH05997.1 hypothetical protein A1704_06680 [Chryseobacterium cucumeris]QWT84874.1 hypothetical protein KBP46_15435 [Chryseobacterium sp. PCH239]ROH92817.1 hypothetical protein EGI15_11435 [Chryseobacterium cucumeris]WFB65983.1 hypothetical protein PZ898_14710 [Chryseobacterium sp. WX]
MSYQAISEEKKELVREVMFKALNDADYKARLVNNPVEAIKELHSDFTLGGNKKIVVVDQVDNDTYYINLSYLSYALFGGDIEEFELSEEELGMVAGGKTVPIGSCQFLSCFGNGLTEDTATTEG